MKQQDTIVQEQGGNFPILHQRQNADAKVMEKHKKFPLLVYMGSGISILLVIIIGAISLYFSEQQKNKEQWVEHTYTVLDNAELVRQGLYEMEISKHGYNTTSDLRFLKQYHTSSIILFSKLNALNALVKDNPSEMARVRRLRAQINSLLNFWQTQNYKPINTLTHSEIRFPVVEKSKLDDIGASIDEITVAENQLLVQREDSNRALRQKTNHTIIAGTLMIMIIVSFLIYFTLREMKFRIVAYQKESEMNRLKSNFVSLASHEFRTPLSTILLSTALVDKYGELHHDNSILKHSNKIKTAVNNLKVILNDFLSLEKLNAGKIQPRLESFDLVKLCEDIAEEMSPTLAPGQQLYYEHKGTGSVVTLDENLLRNAIVNLVSNATKYAGDGAIIELTTDISDNRVSVVVKDNGIGIAKEDQKELFSPFYRINHTGKIPGTGLGLNIVQRYVNLMNGTIVFESKPMQETRFEMSFHHQHF